MSYDYIKQECSTINIDHSRKTGKAYNNLRGIVVWEVQGTDNKIIWTIIFQALMTNWIQLTMDS